MARMPGAIWKPLAADWASQPRMRAYDFFCIHTMVGGLDGTDGFFRNKNGIGYGGAESHFGVGPDGTIYQWQDTDFQADANYNGGWHVISSENADTGFPFPAWGGSDVPALTPEQVESNADIAVWLYRTHGIPLSIAGSSKPGARGLAVHRYGVPGYMPAGAEQWSTSMYKACPGDRRIAQLPAISARAQQKQNGDDDVSYSQWPKEDRDKLLLEVRGQVATELKAQRNDLIAGLLDWRVAKPGGGAISLGDFLRYSDDVTNATRDQLTKAVAGAGTDPEALATALKDALGDQLAADVAARLTVSAKPTSAA